jgi:hypothetical protein
MGCIGMKFKIRNSQFARLAGRSALQFQFNSVNTTVPFRIAISKIQQRNKERSLLYESRVYFHLETVTGFCENLRARAYSEVPRITTT